MGKRVLGALLSLCLLLCLLPVGALRPASSRRGGAAALLAGTGENPDERVLPETVYGITGDSAVYGAGITEEAAYQTAEGGEWIEDTLAGACAGVYSGGTVKVLRDIELEEGITITRPLTVTSNGDTSYTITYSPKDRGDYLLTVQTSGQVALTNIILDGGRQEGRDSKAELAGVRSGELTLESGAVLQNNNNANTDEGAGGLRVMNNGQAVMQAGSVIRNCRAVAGGGAAVASSKAIFVLNGGSIQDCEAFIGGGVYVNGKGKLYLYDNSAILHNRAKKTLEGIDTTVVRNYLKGCGGGIFVMSGYAYLLGGTAGGTVAENTAESCGGGIHVNAGVVQLANGSVTKNYAASYGGGVLTNPAVNILVGNGPNVNGNASGKGHFDNLYLDGGESDDGSTDYTWPMIIGASLWENASIGVSRWVRPDEKHPYRVVATPNGNQYTITESDLKKFFSDDPQYVTLFHEKNIAITTADVRFDNQGHGETPPSQKVEQDHKVDEPAPPEARGYDFKGWYTEPGHENEWDFDKDEILDDDEKPRILYARWDLIHYPIEYVLDGGENAAGNPDDYTIESDDIILQEPRKVGCRFLGWKVEISEGTRSAMRRASPRNAPDIPAGSTGKATCTAMWEKADPCTVRYQDGAGNTVFPEQVYKDLQLWTDTPAFDGTPTRPGYAFTGWDPEVETTVSGNAVYTAQWRELPKYTVIYKDGAEGKVFADQVTENVYEGTATPPFDGTPEREGYTFLGWDSEVSPAVTKDAVYTALWEENAAPKPPDPPGPPSGGDDDDDSPPVNPDPGEEPSQGPGTEPPQDPGTEPPQDPGAEPEPEPGTEPAPDPGTEPIPDPGTEPEPEPEPEPVPSPKPDPIPQTGDPTHTALWAGCALASLAGIILVLRPRRRRR